VERELAVRDLGDALAGLEDCPTADVAVPGQAIAA
jgi:hypothetical protein